MRGGHGSSGKDLGRSVVESRDDVEAGSPDINTGAEVREGSFGVGDGGGGNGDGLLDTSRRTVGNVLVLVPGSNDNGDTGVKKLDEEQEIQVDEWLDQVVSLTRTTASSTAFETPPPRLREATVGVRVRWNSEATKLRPEML